VPVIQPEPVDGGIAGSEILPEARIERAGSRLPDLPRLLDLQDSKRRGRTPAKGLFPRILERLFDIDEGGQRVVTMTLPKGQERTGARIKCGIGFSEQARAQWTASISGRIGSSSASTSRWGCTMDGLLNVACAVGVTSQRGGRLDRECHTPRAR
jgi:hypothetical protein